MGAVATITPDSYMSSGQQASVTPPSLNPDLTPDGYMQLLQNKPAANGPNVPGADPSSILKMAPQFVPGLLTGTGAALFDVPGAIAGSATGNLLKSLAPGIFGEGPKDVTEALTNIGTDAAAQGLTGFLGDVAAGGLGSGLSDVPGISKLPGVKAAQAAEDAYHGSLVNSTKTLQDAFDEEKAAEAAHANYLASQDQKPVSYKSTQNPGMAAQFKEGTRRELPDGSIQVLKSVPIDEISGDPGNTINEEVVQHYQENPSNVRPTVRLNPYGGYTIDEGHHRLLAEVRNGETAPTVWVPEQASQGTGKALLSAQANTKKAQQDFDTTVQSGPQLPKTEEPTILSTKGAGKYLLRTAAVGGIGHALGSYEAGAGIVLTGSQLAKLAKSPQLGAAILTAQRTPASSSASGLINKLILHNLVGETVDLEDGKKATIDQNGNPQPTE